MKPKWVIFDVGQVLYDYEQFITEIAVLIDIPEMVLKESISDILSSSEKGELTFEEVWMKVLSLFEKDEEYENLLKIWWDQKKFLADTKLLLKELDKAGYSIALFSNNWPNLREKILKSIDGEKIVKFFFESSVEKLRKPDVRFYKLVEDRIKAKGSEIYFIDDRQENVDTGESLGWQTFLYRLGNDNGKISNDKIRKQLL